MRFKLNIAALAHAAVVLLVTCLTSIGLAAAPECMGYYKGRPYRAFVFDRPDVNRPFEIWLDSNIPESKELSQLIRQRSEDIAEMLKQLSNTHLPNLDKHIAIILKLEDTTVDIEGPHNVSLKVRSQSMQLMGKNIQVKVADGLYIPSLKSAKDSRVIVMPIGPNGEGFSLSALAHEIGHISQKDFDSDWQRSPYLWWNETRSDLISYLMTGSTAHTFDKEFLIRKVDLFGEQQEIRTQTIRNWANPSIAHVTQLRPSIATASHENSELLTHVLWMLSQKFGKSVLPEFINWIDTLDLNSSLSKSNLPDAGNASQVEYVRKIVQSRHKEMGSLIRKWANKKNRFSRKELAAINAILENAGM